MSDGPREMAIDLKWVKGRVQVVLVHGDRTLFSDTVDPRSQISRSRVLNNLQAKFSTIDIEDLDGQLLVMAVDGPPEANPGAAASRAIAANPEPWPRTVDGAEILDAITAMLRRYIILPALAAEAIALWILASYVYDCFEYSPRLLINSPIKRCGKSRLLRLIMAMVNRALACDGLSAAVMFRSIEIFHPTLLMDEADTYLRGRHANEDLRGVINAGFQRGGQVLRCHPESLEPIPFDVFCPVVIAMIGRPADTIEDRSIVISMRRRMKGESVERLRPGKPLRQRPEFQELVQKCVRWAADSRDALARSEPSAPEALDDRAADIWLGLLAVADAAGGHWPTTSRNAAASLSTDRDGSDGDGLGVQLLSDLRELLVGSSVDKMSTAGLITELSRLETRPWGDYRRGRPISARQLAKLVEPFGVRPRTIRTPDGGTPKGYVAADFEDAWQRYLPASPPPTGVPSATTPHALFDKDLGQIPSATPNSDVADENGRNPLENQACGVVADGTPPEEEETDSHADLQFLVSTMAEELADLGAGAPFGPDDLRHYYDDLVRASGVSVALDDARARYRSQLAGRIDPLGRAS